MDNIEVTAQMKMFDTEDSVDETIEETSEVKTEETKAPVITINVANYYGETKPVDLSGAESLDSFQPLSSLTTAEYTDLYTTAQNIDKKGETLSQEDSIAIGLEMLGEALKPKGVPVKEYKLANVNTTLSMKRVIPEGSSPSQRKARLYATVGAGSVVETFLPHSGFYITVRTLNPVERARVNAITTEGLGNSVSGLLLSTNVGVLVKNLVEFVFNNLILSHTLKKLTKSKDAKHNTPSVHKNPLDYVVEADYQIILNVLLSVINMKIDNVITCKNVKELKPVAKTKEKPEDVTVDQTDEDTEVFDYATKCNTTVTAELDPVTFLVVKDIPEEAQQLINRKGILIDDVIKYQQLANPVKTIKINDEVTISLQFTSITKYFETSTEWVDYLDSTLTNLLLDEEESRSLIAETISSSVLTLYKHLFKSITVNGDTYDSLKSGEIEMALEALSITTDISSAILEHIQQFITETLFIIGVVSYMCPTCSKKVGSEGDTIIGLDILHTFFFQRDMTHQLKKESGQY